MINFVKILSSEISSIKTTIVKFLRSGKDDIRTCTQVSPFGIDSKPIKGVTAVYVQTQVRGDNAIVGYVIKNSKSNEGETRFYSTDTTGLEKTYILLKNDGKIEIGGNNYTSVRYSPLNSGLQSQTNSINTELGKIAVVLNSLAPGSYTLTPITVNISQSESVDIKLK